MTILKYDEFKNIINNKSIVYVPIISCINRETNEYDLSSDGNVNRFITTFSICDSYKSLCIILPKKHVDGSEKLLNQFKDINKNIEFVYLDNFGIHAGEQRNDDNIVNGIYEKIKEYNADIFIFESQKLGKQLIENKVKNTKYIFYNPVSKTKEKTRNFLEGYDDINEWLFEHSDYMIVSSPDQLNFFDNGHKDEIIYLYKLIDRNISLFDYVVNDEIKNELDKCKTNFYLPYRLTDDGYDLPLVLKTLYDVYKYDKNIKVYYTDPNNSKFFSTLKLTDDWKDCFVQVSSDRNTYYTFIDHPNVIIPYYEDLDFINHAAIHEFISDKAKCKIWLSHNNNPYDIMSCPRAEIKYYKPTLIVIEGQDQTGKDTLLNDIDVTEKNIFKYKQPTHEDTGTDYRDKTNYEEWLKNYIENQICNLIILGQTYDTIILTRLIVTDNVYSDLFGRDHIVEKYFKNDIYNNFDVKTYCLLWNSYEDYLNRISKYTNEIEYNEDEFNKIKDLYKKYVDSKNIIYINSETTKKEVLRQFMHQYSIK